MSGFSAISGGTVSSFVPPVALPSGNAETITKALGPYPNARERDFIRQAAESGFFSYNEPSCSSGGIGGPSIGKQFEGQALRVGLNAIPLVGPILSSFSSLIFGFGQHHAQAVKLEQRTLCQAVPDANNFLRGIDSAIASGELDRATAAQALEQGFQNWREEVRAILKDAGGKCNAACVYEKAFRAAIEKRKIDYGLTSATLAGANQGVLGGVVNAISGAVSSVEALFHRPARPTALQAAGFTEGRQNSLALVVIVGASLLISFLVFRNKSKEAGS